MVLAGINIQVGRCVQPEEGVGAGFGVVKWLIRDCSERLESTNGVVVVVLCSGRMAAKVKKIVVIYRARSLSLFEHLPPRNTFSAQLADGNR